jgi:biotin transport system substrate-specific component
VLLAGAFLGPRNGAVSQLAYIGAGVLGAPVFAGGAFGFARLLGPSGGYLLAFPAAAAVVGYMVARRRTLGWTFVSMALGLVIIFAAGTAQLYALYLHDSRVAFNAGFLLFSWWDVLKLSAAAMIYHEAAKRRARLP